MGTGGWRSMKRNRNPGISPKPGAIGKVLRWGGRILLAAAALCGVLAMLKWTVLTGTPSTELWDPQVPPDLTAMPAVVKPDGQDFRILLLSDLQLEANPFVDGGTLRMVDGLVAKTNPDLILANGDNTYLPLQDLLVGGLVRHLDSYGIPWDVTLGNHDAQFLADRNWHAGRYAAGEHSLFQTGPSNIHGVGNHAVRVTDTAGRTLYALVLMDSHAERLYERGKDYDALYPDQIHWYEWLRSGLVQDDGQLVPSMLFFHIPLPEYRTLSDAWKTGTLPAGTFFGENREPVCAAPVNSGMFAAVTQAGGTTHIFAGHDHINSLSAVMAGVRLTYGLKTGADSYNDADMQGGTLITIHDGPGAGGAAGDGNAADAVEVAHISMAK